MKFFPNYETRLKALLTHNTEAVAKAFSQTQIEKGIRSRPINESIELVDRSVLFEFDPSSINRVYGLSYVKGSLPSIGDHPEFAHIEHNEYEMFHTVSAFIDIRGSTRLSAKYTLQEIRLIKNTFLSMAIVTCHAFGGHIQRLQGDGLLVYFTSKNKHKNDSIIQALNAASLLCFVVANELKDAFEAENIGAISIRVGIDFGPDDKVMWSRYGFPNCNELTTTSLHTDLAAKLQAKAEKNGIVIGDNIIKELDLPTEFRRRLVNSDDTAEYYIFRSTGLNYGQWVFDWDKYLNSFPFYQSTSNGVIYKEPEYTLRCFIHDGTNYSARYYPNSLAIPKDLKIRYRLYKGDIPLNTSHDRDKIIWRVENRGTEASVENLNFTVNDFKDKPFCDTTTKYLGHHYMICELNGKVLPKFPIFVSDI